ncbi:hypothetical protein ACHAXS_004757, partial [Conticribra weissflogii]
FIRSDTIQKSTLCKLHPPSIVQHFFPNVFQFILPFFPLLLKMLKSNFQLLTSIFESTHKIKQRFRTQTTFSASGLNISEYGLAEGAFVSKFVAAFSSASSRNKRLHILASISSAHP